MMPKSGYRFSENIMLQQELEWAMLSRISAAACAAALVVGAFAPEQSAARGGAAVGGVAHAGGIHAGGVRPTPRPTHPTRPPLAHARHVPQVPFHGAPFRHDLRAHAFRAATARHQRALLGCCTYDSFGYPTTYGDDGMFYGSYYDPSDFVGPLRWPAYADPPAAPAAVAGREAQGTDKTVDRGACRSETVAMPSAGGERSVTITRC
jgi:hypothetical protein